MFIRILALCALAGPVACTTASKEASFGVQDSHVGFIPARTAILPCLKWPEGTRFATKALSNAAPATFTSLCDSFDRFTLNGFSGQPFMKGYSPAFVTKALATSGKSEHLNAIPSLWNHRGTDCMSCSNIASFYNASIANRTDWQMWLGELSRSVRNVDAVLIPTVLYAWDRRYNDRGVLVLERAAGAALLLVSTATGELIWAGMRAAVVPVRKLESEVAGEAPSPPDWSLVSERIFTEHLWNEFPGRQIY